jgi:DNA mismatch repair ATPase MutL
MAGRIPACSTAGEAGKVRYDKGTTGSRRMDLNDLGAFYSDPRFDRENKRGSSPLGIPVTILYNRFLITRHEDEYRVIDIKRLKRYALTAALEKGFSEAAIIQRPLMVPVTLTLAEQHVDFIMAHQNLLQRLGMEILQSGPQNLTVRSIPSLLPDLDIAGFFNRFVMRKKVSKTPVDGDVSEILSVLVEFSGSENRLSASLDEIYPELLSLDNLDLPFSEKKHPSFWNTLSESELVDLVNDGD